ncbi:MAG TPA: type IV pilus twitching motility protein PilT [Actinomycetota bacterium]|nr:type IV pilus twitching motility protein PilT [Actinomycetota bacterium]
MLTAREFEDTSAHAAAVADLMTQFNGWLRLVVERDASDLHLKVGVPPKIRDTGVLSPIDGYPRLEHAETERIAGAIVPDDRRERLREVGEVDFAYSVPGVGRFRANVFRQRGSLSMVFRKLRFGGPTFAQMRLPDTIRVLSEEPRGLVLVTGPTGSGKTTTLAAMIEHLNHTRPCHVVTIEDPIEVLFEDDTASINQREVGNDTESFLSALRAALRQDPDVILIGEMRDTETVRAALQAAETGHLVLSTLHTVDTTETVNRVIDFFPPYQQSQIRLTLAGALRGIVCQRLVPDTAGGLVPSHEILVNTGRVAERIADEEKTAEIHDVIAEGSYYGMTTFDQSLLSLVQAGTVTVEHALTASSNPHDLQLQLQQAGVALPL